MESACFCSNWEQTNQTLALERSSMFPFKIHNTISVGYGKIDHYLYTVKSYVATYSAFQVSFLLWDLSSSSTQYLYLLGCQTVNERNLEVVYWQISSPVVSTQRGRGNGELSRLTNCQKMQILLKVQSLLYCLNKRVFFNQRSCATIDSNVTSAHCKMWPMWPEEKINNGCMPRSNTVHWVIP